MSTAIAVQGDQAYWSDRQMDVLHSMGMQGTPAQMMMFLAYCQNTGLDPFSRQIYMISYGGKPTVQTGIDGFRLIAQQTGDYKGQVGPYWAGADGEWREVWLESTPPLAARVGVLRAGFDSPLWGTVTWAEFGSDKSVWKTMPAHMLAKVAESHALRKAFPQQMSGLYTSEEMTQATQHQEASYHAPQAPERANPIPAPTTTRKPAQERTEPVDEATGEIVEAEIVEDSVDMATSQQVKKLQAQFTTLKVRERDHKIQLLTILTEREIGSSKDLTKDEASHVIDHMDGVQHADNPEEALAFTYAMSQEQA